MNKNHATLLAMLLLIVFSSCEGEMLNPSILNKSIKVNAKINKTNTRATDNSWEAGDMIGIYMIKSGSKLTDANALHKNGKYTTNGDASFAPANDAVDIKFPDDGSKVDFISYYPYTEGISKSFKYPINVSSQENQSLTNLLYSDNSKGQSRTNNNVDLTFTSVLTQIRLNISNSDKISLNNVRVSLKGVYTKGEFSLVDKSFTASSKGSIRMKTNSKGNYSEALVLPTNSMSGIMLEIINGNMSYTYDLEKLTKIESFESGYTYQMNVNFDSDNTTIGVVVNPSSSINPWKDGPSEEITLGPGNKVEDGDDDNGSITEGEGDGSEENPYSITKAQLVGEESNVWVKGYIVGYYTGTTIKSFGNSFASSDNIRDTCIALAESPDEDNWENTFPVFLKTGDMRDNLNLKDNKNMIGREVMIRGHLTKYYKSIGFNDSSVYKILD